MYVIGTAPAGCTAANCASKSRSTPFNWDGQAGVTPVLLYVSRPDVTAVGPIVEFSDKQSVAKWMA